MRVWCWWSWWYSRSMLSAWQLDYVCTDPPSGRDGGYRLGVTGSWLAGSLSSTPPAPAQMSMGGAKTTGLCVGRCGDTHLLVIAVWSSLSTASRQSSGSARGVTDQGERLWKTDPRMPPSRAYRPLFSPRPWAPWPLIAAWRPRTFSRPAHRPPYRQIL